MITRRHTHTHTHTTAQEPGWPFVASETLLADFQRCCLEPKQRTHAAFLTALRCLPDMRRVNGNVVELAQTPLHRHSRAPKYCCTTVCCWLSTCRALLYSMLRHIILYELFALSRRHEETKHQGSVRRESKQAHIKKTRVDELLGLL